MSFQGLGGKTLQKKTHLDVRRFIFFVCFYAQDKRKKVFASFHGLWVFLQLARMYVSTYPLIVPLNKLSCSCLMGFFPSMYILAFYYTDSFSFFLESVYCVIQSIFFSNLLNETNISLCLFPQHDNICNHLTQS